MLTNLSLGLGFHVLRKVFLEVLYQQGLKTFSTGAKVQQVDGLAKHVHGQVAGHGTGEVAGEEGWR